MSVWKRGKVYFNLATAVCAVWYNEDDSRSWSFLLLVGIYQMGTASLFHKHGSVPAVCN